MILGYFIFVMTMFITSMALKFVRMRIYADPANYKNYYIYYSETSQNFSRIYPDLIRKSNLFLDLQNYIVLDTLMYANVTLYGIIAVATILLIVVFKRSIRDRQSMLGKTTTNISAKETRLVQSVIVVCAIFIFTSGPVHFIEIMGSFGVRYDWRVSFVLGIICQIAEAANHSINIFVYLAMNSKFRNTFKGSLGWTLIRRCCKRNS